MAKFRLIGSASFRLTAIYGLIFTASTLALGAGVYRIVAAEIAREFDARIEEESDALLRLYADAGVERLQSVLAARDAGALLNYGLQTADGRLIAGGLKAPVDETGHSQTGWVETPDAEGDEAPEAERETLRALVRRLPDGSYLLVGDELRRSDQTLKRILTGFGWASAATLALALAGGLWISRQFLSRIDAMRAAARAIMAGEWSRRIEVGRADDDLARLARTFNRLFERIETLLLANRHVSADIAHDLRKPLARTLRRLEAGLEVPDLPAPAVQTLEGAADEIEGVLTTFEALLRLGQVKAGARRAAFRELDLGLLAHEIAEAYRPSLEDSGRQLVETLDQPFPLLGDRELLAQMFANLFDNAMRHTPQGTTIRLAIEPGPKLIFADDGPGVPQAELASIFQRYFRADAGRETPGSGLGLALVAAIAELHELEGAASSNQPGLRMTFVTRAEEG